jgi:hypothetical protein
LNISLGLFAASPRLRPSGCGLSASIPARLSNKSFFIFYRSVDYALVFNVVIFHFPPNSIKKHDFGGKCILVQNKVLKYLSEIK